MTMERQISEERDQMRPIQFLILGEQSSLPAPLVRITTCGLLAVELLEEVISNDPAHARYISLTPEQLRGRGAGPALTILKLLLSRPERFATHEWLMEQFGRNEELISSKRIYDLVSLLRNVLCSSALPVAHDLRMQLVARVRSSNCDGYQLASHPLIWVDQDALAWNVEQATRMERFNDTTLALPFWERAYELARRGPYLPDERYADWATFRREQVAGMLRQSVQALARLYQEQHGAAGEEEALRLLRTYWLEHPHEEDVLRPLMELLGKRECMHEALDYYEQLCRVLEEDERQPDSQTQDVATYLRNKQTQRGAIPRVLPLPETPRSSSSAVREESNPDQVVDAPGGTPFDWSSLLSSLRQNESIFLQWLMKEQTLPMSLNQLLKDEDITMDIVRRKLLQLGAVGATLLFSPPVPLAFVKPHEDTLSLLENGMTARWMLYYTGGAIRSSVGFDVWLQEATKNAQFARGTTFSEQALLILCMSYQLQGCILRDMMRFEEAHKAFRKAFIIAKEMVHPEMMAATLAREGVTFTQQDQPTEAIGSLSQAQELIQYLGLSNLEGYILQALSEAHAKVQSPVSWKMLERAEGLLEPKSQVSESSLARFNTASVIAQRGVNAALLHDYAKSVTLIDQSLKHYDATLIRGRARLLMQKAEAYWNLEALNACTHALQEAFLLAQSAGASKTIARAKHLHQTLLQSPWGKEREVIALHEVISSDHIS